MKCRARFTSPFLGPALSPSLAPCLAALCPDLLTSTPNPRAGPPPDAAAGSDTGLQARQAGKALLALFVRHSFVCLRRCRGRTLYSLRLVVLLHDGVARFVFVMFALKRVLLLDARISIACILALIDRQRCRRRHGTAIPVVPSAPALFPSAAPMLTPTGRRIRTPRAKVHRRLPVVPDRDAQDEDWHRHWGNENPRTVVPRARVPVISLVDPVHPVVEEVVRIQLRRVVDRVAGHQDERWIHGHIDSDADAGKPDTDAYLSGRRGDQAKRHPQCDEFVAHFFVNSAGRREWNRQSHSRQRTEHGIGPQVQQRPCLECQHEATTHSRFRLATPFIAMSASGKSGRTMHCPEVAVSCHGRCAYGLVDLYLTSAATESRQAAAHWLSPGASPGPPRPP